MLKAYEKVFPDLFTPRSRDPAAAAGARALPGGAVQRPGARRTPPTTSTTRRFSTTRATSGQIPDNVSLSGPGPMQAYYVIMKLPGATKEEFLLMLPFVPNGRSNMIAWLGARSDVPDYGKALNFVFSKSTTVFGPSQVEATINQDPEISAQRTLWGQQGSAGHHGQPAGGAHPGLAAVRAAAVPAVRPDAAAAAQARDRLLPGAGAGRRQRQRAAGRGHGAHARRGAHSRLRAAPQYR